MTRSTARSKVPADTDDIELQRTRRRLLKMNIAFARPMTRLERFTENLALNILPVIGVATVLFVIAVTAWIVTR